jgi:hypothetical protein
MVLLINIPLAISTFFGFIYTIFRIGYIDDPINHNFQIYRTLALFVLGSIVIEILLLYKFKILSRSNIIISLVGLFLVLGILILLIR